MPRSEVASLLKPLRSVCVFVFTVALYGAPMGSSGSARHDVRRSAPRAGGLFGKLIQLFHQQLNVVLLKLPVFVQLIDIRVQPMPLVVCVHLCCPAVCLIGALVFYRMAQNSGHT